MANFRINNELTVQEGLDIYKTSADQALAELSRKGFAPPPMPMYQTAHGMQPYRGEVPADITTMSDDQLGTCLGRLSEWNAYVQFQLAEADSQLLAAKADLALVEAKLRIAYKVDEEGKKRSNPERDDHVGVDVLYLSANSKMVYWETMYRYTKAIALATESAFATVSRRITQRGQEMERERRNQGVPHIPPQGRVFGGNR